MNKKNSCYCLVILICTLILVCTVGCNDDDEGMAPDLIELSAQPNPVHAGDVSVISFRLQPNSKNEVFTWNATLDPTTAGGGYLEASEGNTRPMELVSLRFFTKNPTTDEDATIIISPWDPAIPLSSTNKGRLYTIYIKVIP